MQETRGPLYSRKVKRYGIKLMPKLYEHLNPLTEDESIKLEKELSEQLREGLRCLVSISLNS